MHDETCSTLLSFLLDNYNNDENPTLHWFVGFSLSIMILK